MSTHSYEPLAERYVILRTPFRRTRDFQPNLMAVSEPAPDVQVEVDDHVDKRTLNTLAKDATVVGFSPVMPMKLIEPVALCGSESTEIEAASQDEVTWGVEAVGATTSPFTGNGITVAVLDTGIDADHVAFDGVDLVTKDFSASGSAHDTNGHGTHCAGTIFGRNVEGTRIGVAPGVNRAVIGKVLGPNGGSSEILTEAMIWARDNGAHVISMSLGIDFPGYVESLVRNHGIPLQVATSMGLHDYAANVKLFETLSQFLAAGIGQPLVVAASGNESRRNANPPYELNVASPAAAAGIVAVGALGRAATGLDIAHFSNTRATVAAPGVEVISARTGGGLRSLNGTSMATPHAAGVAALWAEKLATNGQLTPQVLQARLIGFAGYEQLVDTIDPLDVGSGLVRAPQA
ncbi:MAG: S8 family serine peptidase [Ancrocorticia sp.]